MIADTPTHAPITAVIVAGGKSTRLGQDKRQLRLWGAAGPTLLEHTIAIMRTLCDEVVVVLNDPHQWTDLPARIVPDVMPDSGSLGGIYSGLVAATHPYVFAVAADMPFISSRLIRWMIDQPRDYDVLAPQSGASQARNRLGVESLHAIYGQACREPIRRQLEAGNPQVIGFFPQVRVRLIEPHIILQVEPSGRAFRNINTPQELDEARKMLQST